MKRPVRPLRLQGVLRDAEISQAELARHCGVSTAAISLLLARGQWPARDAAALRRDIVAFLRDRGLEDSGAFERMTPPRGNAAGPATPTTTVEEGVTTMVLRKQRLTEAARRAFNLQRDPFGQPTEPADVFMSADIRYVRESMMSVARHGGFLAVIAESGAGKTTLREELIERMERELQGVIVIQPYVIAMEDSDGRGKVLKALHIGEAIMSAVAPLTGIKSSPEARFRQLHTALRDSGRTGNRHVLIIEEAHSLPIPTLRHLKRFLELKDGLRPLLSIILLGQPELATKLSEQNPEVREVVQRIEVVRLASLDSELEPYLQHRFTRAGSSLDQVLERGAIDAVRELLASARSQASLLYPLAVQNLVAGAMNAAAELGAPKVTADLVRGA